MSLNQAHAQLANAAMQVKAYEMYGKRARIPQNIIDASYNATLVADQRLRPGSNANWYRATARSTNEAIIEEAENAIARVFTRHRVSYDGVAATVAPATIFAVASTVDPEVNTAQPIEISRRAMLGMGVAAAVVAAAMPSQAAADNVSYISTVRRGTSSYATSNAPAIVRSVGAGIRGNFELTPGTLNAPKGPVQA